LLKFVDSVPYRQRHRQPFRKFRMVRAISRLRSDTHSTNTARRRQGSTTWENRLVSGAAFVEGSRSLGSSRWTPRRSAARRVSVRCRLYPSGRLPVLGPIDSSGNGSWYSAARCSVAGCRGISSGIFTNRVSNRQPDPPKTRTSINAVRVTGFDRVAMRLLTER
jgi:hypothetical protein